jgi:multidrug efflux system membrane fusion protein
MPGQFARVRLGEARTQPAISIDERAIGTDQDRRFVMVVGSDNRVHTRPIVPGASIDGARIVKAGLHPGERIVVDGLQLVRPGALVAPSPVQITGSPSAQAAFASR